MRNFTIHQGHVLDVLKGMASESVHCVVTSPPYFGLRAYGTHPQVWDGDPNCDHVWIDTSYQVMKSDNKGNRGNEKQRTNIGTMGRDGIRSCGSCGSCGAWRGELGLEPTPDLFIAHLVLVFREVKRVMRGDGLLWVNIGDSYSGSWGNYGGQNRGNGTQREIEKGSKAHQKAYDGLEQWRPPQAYKIEGMKPGDLMGIPWALATALRADGWYLRRDIIWHKIAPMPESVYGTRWEQHRIRIEPSERAVPGMAHDASQIGVNNPQGARDGVNFKDHSSEYAHCPGCAKCEKNDGLILRRGSGRCTTAHEYIFMFSKTADYFYDTDAIKEPARDWETRDRSNTGICVTGAMPNGQPHSGLTDINFAERGRNKRSVWSLSPQAYPEDHFAAFPEGLPEICIKASTSGHGCCAECRAPYARIMARTPAEVLSSKSAYGNGAGRNDGGRSMLVGASGTTLGWRRTCECSTDDIIPATVLDPFTGRGTTGVVALRLARLFVGIELKPQYVEMAQKNITNDAPLFNTIQQ